MPSVNVSLAGIKANIQSYSFSVTTPTMDSLNSETSSGAISFDTGPLKRTPHYRNKAFTLSDSRFGSVRGRVSELSFGQGVVNFTAETLFQRLTSNSTVPPQFGMSTLDCMNAVLAVGGFSCDGLDDSNTDVFPGWGGSILNYVQLFCAARKMEYTVDGEVLHFRAIRGVMYTDSLKDLSFTLNDQSLAKNVEVTQYDYIYGDDIEFFPAAAQDTPQVLTVETDGRVVYEVKLNGWMQTLNQPVVMDLVGPEIQDGEQGSYCVSANDGLPITVSQWSTLGGRVLVESTEDPSIMRITVWGPSSVSGEEEDTLSPYSIAASSGDGVYYNSLHITGRGIRYTPTTHKLPTGATSMITIDDVGGVVENPFLTTLGAAYDVGLRSAQTYAGPNYALNASTAVAQDYTTILGSRLDSVHGARFRVTAVSVGQSGASMNGLMDNTFDDFNEQWTGKTFGEFSAVWGAYTFLQFNSQWDGQTFADFNVAWAGKTFDDFNVDSGFQSFGNFATTPLLTNLDMAN